MNPRKGDLIEVPSPEWVPARVTEVHDDTVNVYLIGSRQRTVSTPMRGVEWRRQPPEKLPPLPRDPVADVCRQLGLSGVMADIAREFFS